jgi:hypothetical protein
MAKAPSDREPFEEDDEFKLFMDSSAWKDTGMGSFKRDPQKSIGTSFYGVGFEIVNAGGTLVAADS